MDVPRTTWDGLPVAQEKPYGSAVVVWRERGDGEREFLVLHRRAPGAADFEGDWAWTPPTGARQPGEDVEAAARRELREETGLELELTRVATKRDDWALWSAQAPLDAAVALDDEHDRYAWVTLDEACARCLPAVVGDGIRSAAHGLDGT